MPDERIRWGHSLAGVMDRYNSAWMPSLIVEDADGREYRRSLGSPDPHPFLG